MLLVFDLDDTLYDEATFVDSGFRAVAAMLATRYGLDADELTARMRALLAEHGRGQVFDLALAESGITDPAVVADCVTTYRSHVPTIAMRPEVENMLGGLATAGQRMYVVTDGDPRVQRAKAAALELERFITDVYPTWESGLEAAKPSLACFEVIREREGAEWTDVVYVADDPSKDFVSLNRAGATTVRVHTGRFADTAAADGYDAQHHVSDVTEVPRLLGLAVEQRS